VGESVGAAVGAAVGAGVIPVQISRTRWLYMSATAMVLPSAEYATSEGRKNEGRERRVRHIRSARGESADPRSVGCKQVWVC
jgi:hypothetical protein